MFRYKQKRIKLYIALLLSGMLLLGITGCKPLPVQVPQQAFILIPLFPLPSTMQRMRNGETSCQRAVCLWLNTMKICTAKVFPQVTFPRINAHPGEYVTVDPDTITLLQTACEYASLSDGAIDPSIGAVSSLWDFHETIRSCYPPG